MVTRHATRREIQTAFYLQCDDPQILRMRQFSGAHPTLHCAQSACFANWRLPGEETAFIATPGKYVLDFGSVVVGQSRTKIVQLRNASSQIFGVKINKKVGKGVR